MHAHEQPRHDRKMKRHVAFIARAEIRGSIFRPLIGLSQQHAVFVVLVDMAAQVFQKRVGLGQILAARAFALVKIGHGIQPQAVNAHPQPEIQSIEDRLSHGRVVEI